MACGSLGCVEGSKWRMRLTLPNQFEFFEAPSLKVSRQAIVGILMGLALVAFEVFNFDTTQYALANLLGSVSFAGLQWATILAFAFCAIDFAGLARIFTPETGDQEPRAVWYLTGAWLLGATLNAIMTWWAVNLTLLNHDFGNEVLSRAQLLQIVPVFVAALVWLTRILFIGSLSLAGDQMLLGERPAQAARPAAVAEGPRPARLAPKRDTSGASLRTPIATPVNRLGRIADEPTMVHVPASDERSPVGPPRPQTGRRAPATMAASGAQVGRQQD